MRAWLNQRLRSFGLLLLAAALPSCGKPKTPVQAWNVPDRAAATNSTASRPVPRRTLPLVITNETSVEAAATASTTNHPPLIACGAAQTLPCGTLEGLPVTLTAHVGDADGQALSVVWTVDGKERETQQVPAGTPPVTADLTLNYTLTSGDHAVKVTVNDGALSAFCETTVTIQKDTQEPAIACPRDISVPVDPGQCTATVTFAPRATDNCPDVEVGCDPPSGTAFPIGVTVVTCEATDAAGNRSHCGFSVLVQLANRCPKNDGFWRQNPGAWPLSAMTLGNQIYTRSQLVPLLRANVPADASLVLARQVIVATLNTAAGSDPRPICRELGQANSVLGSFGSKLPYRVNVSSQAGRSMVNLSTIIGGYNNGLMSSDCVP